MKASSWKQVAAGWAATSTSHGLVPSLCTRVRQILRLEALHLVCHDVLAQACSSFLAKVLCQAFASVAASAHSRQQIKRQTETCMLRKERLQDPGTRLDFNGHPLQPARMDIHATAEASLLQLANAASPQSRSLLRWASVQVTDLACASL